jgi:hypothetical protein
MKRQVIGVLAGVLGATALIAAQGNAQQATASPQKAAGSDITVTGCLTQGSSPAVFLLSNARQRPEDKTEKAQSYVVVASSEDLPFAANLNHEVSVTGSADKAAASATATSASGSTATATVQSNQNKGEKDMPRFSAKTVTLVADRCTAPLK